MHMIFIYFSVTIFYNFHNKTNYEGLYRRDFWTKSNLQVFYNTNSS